MSAPKAIEDFVARFAENRDVYCSSEYNEMQLRREFLDPFFKALGWDIDNEQGYAEAYKDVVHEDAIKIGRATKAPDYSFRIGGVRKFFVEAKRPSVGIKDDPKFRGQTFVLRISSRGNSGDVWHNSSLPVPAPVCVRRTGRPVCIATAIGRRQTGRSSLKWWEAPILAN